MVPAMDPRDLVVRNAAEVVTDADLEALLERPDRRAYAGFEPSGTAHVGWILLANKLRDLVAAGFDVSVLFADWHALINDKLGGNLENIQACARYMEDVFTALGVPRDEVTYLYASDYVDDAAYWETVVRVAKASTLSRVRRAMSVMGRDSEEAELDFSKTLYPVMQVADIFHHEWHLAYGGLDQRHAHMLARDVADKLGWWKPVALHTPMVPSLQAGGGRMDPIEMKMSKSNPNSGIFLHDDPETVEAKIRDAFCPQGEVEGNPVLALAELLILPRDGFLRIERPEKYGGPLVLESTEALEAAVRDGLHPLDLKEAVAAAMNGLLGEVRAYFEAHPANLERMAEIRRTLEAA